MTAFTLHMVDIEKSFFGISVLKKVNLIIESGIAVGLVGENGAGKSTLMNILGGNLVADQGSMTCNGQPFAPQSALDAASHGIAFVHQELNLFPNLSIAENLFLTQFPGSKFWIRKGQMIREATSILERVGLTVSPNTLIESLSAGERQLVEIAKALNSNAKLLILDEPTTSLTLRETEFLFRLLKSLKAEGKAFIYISHALEDVRSLCDQIVILRDGTVIANGPVQQFDESQIVAMMVGRQIDQQFPPIPQHEESQVVIDVKNASCLGALNNISFTVRSGEIVGIAGLMGSGRTELARLLFGLDRLTSGTITLDGGSIERSTTKQRIERGMAFLTESRRVDGLCMSSSINDNLGIVSAPRYANRITGHLNQREYLKNIAEIRDSVQLTATARGSNAVKTLSGGNQQKVVFAKWLLNRPRFLILDEPTRGVDVGAKCEIYRIIAELAERGVAVLMISSELEELLGMCHRILVMSQGIICDELARKHFDRQRILNAALQSHRSKGAASQ